MSQELFPTALPDCAAEPDFRRLDIDKVGIKDLDYPIVVLDKLNKEQHTVARVRLTVGLPHEFKGTHMSRFIEVLNARRGEMTVRNMPMILAEVQRRLEAHEAHIRVEFPYFVSKRAPVSGAESLMSYRCAFEATRRGGQQDFTLEVVVPVKSLCPCSKSISDRGAHNQRSLVTVRVRSTAFLWIEDVIEAVEGVASAPLYALLKREDEKYITELAYDNPRFVEDMVRETVLAVRALAGVQWLHVEVDNAESIHNHSAWAEIFWSAEEEEDEEADAIAPSDPPPRSEPLSFGAWLKDQRLARGLSQQELAERLGVSGGHLSRVESGDKALSEEKVAVVAAVLGLEESVVRLRAGLLEPSWLEAIARDPEGFLGWVRG